MHPVEDGDLGVERQAPNLIIPLCLLLLPMQDVECVPHLSSLDSANLVNPRSERHTKEPLTQKTVLCRINVRDSRLYPFEVLAKNSSRQGTRVTHAVRSTCDTHSIGSTRRWMCHEAHAHEPPIRCADCWVASTLNVLINMTC